ncbi:MAG: RagB/SusD family nutrient uptake outer membrane protein [Sphingobacteriales bacterium]|nr:MAG: RagB/SusD family nutrient uptake outer membrane protein [Sphingobacteriales bacterium]
MSLLFSACKEKLDLAPFNQIDGSTAYATAERCLLALNGVYDAAQSGVYDPLNGTASSVRGYPFGAAAVEQQDMRGEDMINVATFFAVTYQATYNTTSPNNVNMWKELYALINKANISIEGFKAAGASGVISPTVASQYEAECRFLRAMAHHELLIHFARPYSDGNGSALGVPYRDFAIQSSSSVERAKTLPRERVDTVYMKILADLDFAEANLATLLTGGESTYRATKAAAIALKMRVKLHKNDMPAVIAEGNKLIPGTVNPLNFTSVVSPIGAWSLTPAVNGPFLNNASKESIFSIKHDALDNPQTNASLARMYGQSSTATGGRGLVAISPIAWNLPEWTCADRRRTLLYYNGTDNTGNISKFTSKYTDAVNQSDWTPYIRYAEVLLTQAEAEARNNAAVSQRAIDLLNTVRNRAVADSVTNQYTIASFATKNALINAILKEKRIEFLAEGKRWSDIHRLVQDPVHGTGGVPEKMVNGFNNIGAFVCGGAVPAAGTPFIPYSDYRFLWPIPQQERNTNPIVEQNPQY